APALLSDYCDGGKAHPSLVTSPSTSLFQETILFLSKRHLSPSISRFGRRLLLRAALREALERSVRAAGAAAERGLLDFRGRVKSLAQRLEEEEEEEGEGEGGKGGASSLPLRLCLALADVRKRLQQEEEEEDEREGVREGGKEGRLERGRALLRLFSAYEYIKVLATAAALALASSFRPLWDEVDFSLSFLLSSSSSSSFSSSSPSPSPSTSTSTVALPIVALLKEDIEATTTLLSFLSYCDSPSFLLLHYRLAAHHFLPPSLPPFPPSSLERREALRCLARLAGREGGREAIYQELTPAFFPFLEASLPPPPPPPLPPPLAFARAENRRTKEKGRKKRRKEEEGAEEDEEEKEEEEAEEEEEEEGWIAGTYLSMLLLALVVEE
ncbi:hypothetical protein VYU27_010354, partial [Nannochloropsis oceanica]